MNTDLLKCLCCGQPVRERGRPITPERAERSLAIFTALGLTREELLTKHRRQLEYQSPGFVEWLEARSVSSVECPHCHWGFAPSVIEQHIREKHAS